MSYMRFSIPEYDHDQFKGMNWAAPELLSSEDSEKRASSSDPGCVAVAAPDDVFEKFDIRGDHRHAVMCIVPENAHLLGRSWAWWNQRVVIVDSLDLDAMNVVHDWKAPRPVNTRLGPDDGITLPSGVYYVLSCHQYDDHWIGNRTILQNDWDGGDANDGYRVLATSKDDSAAFGECCLSITWNT